MSFSILQPIVQMMASIYAVFAKDYGTDIQHLEVTKKEKAG